MPEATLRTEPPNVPRRILVMDDSDEAVEAIQDTFDRPMIERHYRMVGRAKNGSEAYKLWRQHAPYDAALLDLRSPGNDREGLQAAIRLRGADSKLPIAIMTMTDTFNVEVAGDVIDGAFEFVDKDSLLRPTLFLPYLNLLCAGASLPLPDSIRRMMMDHRGRPGPAGTRQAAGQATPHFSLSPTWRKIASLYKNNPHMVAIEMAELLGVPPETLHQEAKRLRRKLREEGWEIPEDASGRQAVVKALEDLRLL